MEDNNFQLQTAKKFFAQEAQVLQNLGKHPQIPTIFDYFEEHEEFFLVQEFIDGQNFAGELEDKKQLNESETKDFLVNVLQILDFVHKNGYIHRDIKPSNLIRNKFDRKFYLIDFGAVKEKIKSENIDNQGGFTLTIAIGTNGYIPDEQRLGRPEFCSDIYALGIVAIQALTGIHASELKYDCDKNPLWQHCLPTGYYHPNFLALIDKMVCCSLQQRYQSAQEVLEDLNNLNNLSSVDDGKKRMEAWTIKNQKAYVVTYTAEDDRYDRFLGKIEKMIKSFQIVSTDERG